VDTLRYPRDFSLSLACSLLLHALAATVLLQDFRFPSMDAARDVFLVPDWTVTPTVPVPRPPGGGAPAAPSRRSTALATVEPGDSKPRAARPADPKPAEPRRGDARDQRSARKAEPRPARAPVDTSAPRLAAEPSAPTLPAAPVPSAVAKTVEVIAPAVAPDAIAPPRPQPEVTVLSRIEAPPAAPKAPLETKARVVDRGKAQAPPVQPGVTNTDGRPLPPPSQWRDAQPLVPVPPLAAMTPAEAPGVKPSTELTPAPSLGLPVPPTSERAVSSVVPAPATPSPLDWEVPAAEDRGTSSIGRAKEGADSLTGAGMAPAPTPSVAGALSPQVPPEGRVSGAARAAERPTAPAPGGAVQPFTGTSDVSTPAAPSAPAKKSDSPTGSVGSAAPTSIPAPAPRGDGDRGTTPAIGTVSPAPSAVEAAPAPAARVAPAPTTAATSRTEPGARSTIAPSAPPAIDTRSGSARDVAGEGAIVPAAPGPAGPTTAGETRPDTTTGRAGPAIAQGGAGGSSPERAGTPGGVSAPGEERAGAQGGTSASQERAVAQGSSQERTGARGPGRVAITTPQNGHTLSPDDPPIVIVRGRVDDPEVSTVWLAANSRRIPLRVREGKFEYPLVVVDRSTTISAEAPSGSVRRSEPVTVHAAPNAVTTGVVILDWGETKPAGQVEMTATWRARADRLDGQQAKVLVRVAPLPGDIAASAFYVRNLQAGVYTFVLGYRGLDAATRLLPRFYVTTPGVPTARDLKPLSLAGTGRTPAVRILLPQAVLWEQDEWFTGRSEASDTITKFRDDGTSWIERKGEPR
jgi:hypothetical protein